MMVKSQFRFVSLTPTLHSLVTFHLCMAIDCFIPATATSLAIPVALQRLLFGLNGFLPSPALPSCSLSHSQLTQSVGLALTGRESK